MRALYCTNPDCQAKQIKKFALFVSRDALDVDGLSEMTLEKLHQYNFTDGIRVKEEVDKDKAAGWPDERLELVGLKRQTSDAFFIEIKRDAVPEQTA